MIDQYLLYKYINYKFDEKSTDYIKFLTKYLRNSILMLNCLDKNILKNKYQE